MVVFEKMQAFFRYFIVSSLRDELCEASYYAGLSIILPSSKNSMVAAPVSI